MNVLDLHHYYVLVNFVFECFLSGASKLVTYSFYILYHHCRGIRCLYAHLVHHNEYRMNFIEPSER
jgi:hypothetical protein